MHHSPTLPANLGFGDCALRGVRSWRVAASLGQPRPASPSSKFYLTFSHAPVVDMIDFYKLKA